MKRGRMAALIIGLAIPWFLFVVISPMLNFPTPRILGMPPLMFYDSIGIVITSILLGIAYKFERRGGIIERNCSKPCNNIRLDSPQLGNRSPGRD